jgi:hypothetical protein
VTVTAGLGGRMAGGVGGAGEQAVGDGVVTIELAGVDAAGLARLADMPGVLSGSGAAAGRVLLRVAARQSDAVLRRALAWDGVHVAGVGRVGADGDAGVEPQARP